MLQRRMQSRGSLCRGEEPCQAAPGGVCVQDRLLTRGTGLQRNGDGQLMDEPRVGRGWQGVCLCVCVIKGDGCAGKRVYLVHAPIHTSMHAFTHLTVRRLARQTGTHAHIHTHTSYSFLYQTTSVAQVQEKMCVCLVCESVCKCVRTASSMKKCTRHKLELNT